MVALFDLSLYSPASLLGLIWSAAIFYLLYSDRGMRVSSSRWAVAVAFVAAYFSIPLVVVEVDALTQVAGGVPTLDGHLFYGSSDIPVFADGLGEAGRVRYALFQLGLDTLAPAAFAGFMLTVGRSTVPFERVRRLLTLLVSVYFFSVLFANALMPVYMLNYPAQDALSSVLYSLLPILDGLKYAAHGVVWLVILGSWVFWLANKRNQREKVLEVSVSE